MKKSLSHNRSSGILAHLTSLPSNYGIGDLGPGALNFIDFLDASSQSIWQILPTGPTDSVFSHSPYMSVSAFAGNPLLISPDCLVEEGLISKNDVSHQPFSPYHVNFDAVSAFKTALLRKAYMAFSASENNEYSQFRSEQKWLDDYCLFMALKKHHPGKPWYQFDRDISRRTSSSLSQLKKKYKDDMDYYCFEQFTFFKQWQSLREYANSKNINIFGDIPIYVSLDSADVWANQVIFQLDDRTGTPTRVAGVPPDYFSETGQKWGNPLYRWDSTDQEIREKLLEWWAERFANIFSFCDLARIDHFRGFESYWSVPAEEETALNGKWEKGPGAEFFHEIFAILGDLKIVAEDLGEITQEVLELREKLKFPGMKVLQFAFDGDISNSFLPFNYDHSNFFVYSGTHDNDTTVGWFLDGRFNDNQRESIRSYANKNLHDSSGIHEDLIYLAMSSIAKVCIFPLQDILGFGSDCRMNTPGTASGNWQWRCSPEFLTETKAEWLDSLCIRFGREKTAVIHSEKT